MTNWDLLSSWHSLTNSARGRVANTHFFHGALFTWTESKGSHQRNGQKYFSYWCLLCECPEDIIELMSYMGRFVLIWAVATNVSLLSYQAFNILDNIPSGRLSLTFFIFTHWWKNIRCRWQRKRKRNFSGLSSTGKPGKLWIRSFINFHFSTVYTLIHRRYIKWAVSRVHNATNKGPIKILTSVKRRIILSLWRDVIVPSAHVCSFFKITWLIANQFWERRGELQYNKSPASSLELHGLVENRDARECSENGEKRPNFVRSSLSTGRWLRTTMVCFAACPGGQVRGQQGNKRSCRGVVLPAQAACWSETTFPQSRCSWNSFLNVGKRMYFSLVLCTKSPEMFCLKLARNS